MILIIFQFIHIFGVGQPGVGLGNYMNTTLHRMIKKSSGIILKHVKKQITGILFTRTPTH